MWQQRFYWTGIIAGLIAPVMVVTTVAGQAVSQAYGVTGTVQKGMIVMLDPGNSKKVKALSNTSDVSMLGVVVAANDTAISLSGDSSVYQVFVAASGKYNALVSNQNGAIKAGDIISISALDGIGMKADAGQSVVLGKALSSFDGSSNVSGTATLKTTNGTKNVSIGTVEIDINISHNPLAESDSGLSIPSFLRKSGEGIAGKSVSAARLYTSFGVLVLTLFMTASLLYGGVHSSLVSLGRNPLAKTSILRGLIQVVLLGLIVFVIGLVAIYLLLKL
jgi:hypothetical protein